jgi:hypothetical protein
VRTLLAGRSGVMITRQRGAIVPIPFEEMIDSETGRTRVRMVDTSTESHENAWALQVRIEDSDLDDPDKLDAIAKTARLSREEVMQRYRPLR